MGISFGKIDGGDLYPGGVLFDDITGGGLYPGGVSIEIALLEPGD